MWAPRYPVVGRFEACGAKCCQLFVVYFGGPALPCIWEQYIFGTRYSLLLVIGIRPVVSIASCHAMPDSIQRSSTGTAKAR